MRSRRIFNDDAGNKSRGNQSKARRERELREHAGIAMKSVNQIQYICIGIVKGSVINLVRTLQGSSRWVTPQPLAGPVPPLSSQARSFSSLHITRHQVFCTGSVPSSITSFFKTVSFFTLFIFILIALDGVHK